MYKISHYIQSHMKIITTPIIFLLFFCLTHTNNFDSLHFIVGDSVQINILNNYLEEELTIPKTRINRVDRIILPHLGEFDISDKNILQFKSLLKRRVSKRLYLIDPKLLIDIDKKILVSASIKNRFLGEYNLNYRSSLGELLKAISLINVTDVDFKSVSIIRNKNTINLNLYLEPNNSKFTLKHNDFIKIGTKLENSNNYYYLVGNFSKVGRYYMDTNITIMDVLASQTLTQPRYTRKFYIFRKSKASTMVIDVDARQLMKMGDLTQNISIQGGDVILASVERKMHLLQKYKDILNQYTDLDDFVQNAQRIRLFK
ncbi:hypothetical protein MJH12_20325 [bacterium]|nr:hypothetical protein [bacterium]